MKYKYSICHPDQPKIEYSHIELNSEEVIELIKNYSWLEILKSMDNIPDDYIYYSPSLDFKCVSEERSLGITATLENGKPEFSLWYSRPVKFRPLFGLLSEKTKTKLTDKWDLNLNQALGFYRVFLNKEYEKLEHLITEK